MDFQLPELGEGVYEAELTAWLVKPGDEIKRGQSLMEVMTDKASMEVPSPFAGTITALRAEPGQQVKVGSVVLSYDGTGPATEQTAAEPARSSRVEAAATPNGGEKRPAPAAPHVRTSGSPPAAPSVRLMARKLGVDLARIHGSGPGGRILVDDLAAAVPIAAAQAKPTEPKPDYGTPGTRLKLQGLRRRIAEHMVRAKRSIPHYTYVDECDVTELTRLRQAFREPFAQRGVKLTYLAFFVRAVTEALQEVPIVNASLDETTEEIILHDKYHIGVAVAAPSGLVVPVVHDADRKDLAQIARDIERLSGEVRSGKVKLDDLRGGTFTVSSVGNIGGLIFTPIINHPEAGILGIGRVIQRPMFDATGKVRPADLVYLSFSFDHRIVDGAVGAAFSNAVIRRLQKPAGLLVNF